MKTDSKKVVLDFKLPDFKREEIKVKLSKNLLWVKADRKHKKKTQKKDFFHSEQAHQKFYYSTTLPKINPKKAKVEFKKGVLKIIVQRI